MCVCACVLHQVPIDDEAHLTRQFGSKTLLYVPENHIGGAFRVGLVDDLCEDGDYVIFPQGHHVLPNDNYRSTSVVRLGGESVVRLGPLTMLFVCASRVRVCVCVCVDVC